jgi:hypothetical protein
MSYPENPLDERKQPKNQSSIRSVLVTFACLGGLVVAVTHLPGCGRPPKVITDVNTSQKQESAWKTVAIRLGKNPEADSCKGTISSLNNDLNSDTKAPKPSALTPEAEAAIAAIVPLTEDDRAEIRGAAYSAHDGAYLAECMYLRDVYQSINMAGLKPDELADLGFAWVCRQVYINPWVTGASSDTPTHLAFAMVDPKRNPGRPPLVTGTALPPASVLRRGFGSGLERMYVFLGLLQQMGLDGCLIGPPEAADTLSTALLTTADKKDLITGAPRGPFWAVGVRIGNDIRLYDPWRGQPLPVTLGQLKANPDAQKAWFEDKANVSGATLEDAKKATVFLAVPVNSLSPRMATFQEQLKSDLNVKVSVNPSALRSAFPEPKPAFWNPPKDRFSYGRTARLFLPVEEGGADRTEASAARLYNRYLNDQLPPPEQTFPKELIQNPVLSKNQTANADIVEKVFVFARSSFGAAFLFPPPTPREKLQRGQFQDASRDLVKIQDGFARGLERLHNARDVDKQLKEWMDTAVKLYTAYETSTLESADAVAAAKSAIDKHWHTDGAIFLLDRAISDCGRAEATLLLALCKHEQAERAQTMFEHTTGEDRTARRQEALEAWAGALSSWRSYAERASGHAVFPGRAEHYKTLIARAEKMAKQP